MKKLALAVTLAAALAPGVASAQLAAALRLGYGVGVDDYSQDVTMRKTLNAQIPIQLDLGLRVLPKLSIGVYGSYGMLKVGDVCTPGMDCSGNVIDFGLQAIYRFTTRPVSPWASVGIGWEKTKLDVEGVTSKAEGIDLLRLGAGWEFPVSDGFGIGPFVQYQLGRYSSFDVEGTSGQPERAYHGWFTVGVRGTLDDLTDWEGKAREEAAARAAAEKAAAEAAAKAAAEKAAAEAAAARAAAEAAAKAAAEKAAAEAAAAKAAADAAKPDRDGDKIPDDVDACPDQPGDASADAKKHGCKALIVVTEQGFDLREKIQFQTGKAVVKPESLPILQSVAEALRAHPEITKLSIEGHTDSVGSEAANTALSQKRAAAVVDWLVKQGGIDAGRLVSAGYGPTRPIADNATAEGRAANRRVEMLIVK